jgi:DNA-binding NarL/FixJ family response regulator
VGRSDTGDRLVSDELNCSVLVVEDDDDTRHALVAAVSKGRGFVVSSAASNCAHARAELANKAFDVALIDLGLPDGDGIELIKLASSRYPTLQIMVLTCFSDEQHVIEAIEAGATSYLLKDRGTADVADAIAQMRAGGSPLDPAIARYLLKRIGPARNHGGNGDSANPLTPREQEVIDLIAKGFAYADVGTALCISQNTVHRHIQNLYRKLAVTSRGAAVYEAAALGLVNISKGSPLFAHQSSAGHRK